MKLIICPNCHKKYIRREYTVGVICKCGKELNIDLEGKDIKKLKREWIKSARFLCCDDFKTFERLLKEDEDKNLFIKSKKFNYPDKLLIRYAFKKNKNGKQKM